MIYTDEKIVREKSLPATEEEYQDIIALLEKELKYSALLGRPGIGLAAPQIGIHKRVAIVRLGDTKIDLVNAEIKDLQAPFVFKDEGCLSVPNLKGSVKRYNEIVIDGNLVKPYNFVATGLLAVVIQHEIDHLDGILFVDKVIKDIVRQKPNEPCLCFSGKKYKKCCHRDSI